MVPLPLNLNSALPSALNSLALPPSLNLTWPTSILDTIKHDPQHGYGGYNDWSCKPSANTHPKAVVLVHGTFIPPEIQWALMGPWFVEKGYCVFAPSYGHLLPTGTGASLLVGMNRMEDSARELEVFVDKVLEATQTTQVDIVGYSQGSLMPRYWMKNLGGGPKVHKFVGMASVANGTDLWGLPSVIGSLGLYDPIKKIIDPICESCSQVLVGSEFIRELNKDGDTVPKVEYLMLVSTFDLIITPYQNGFLRDKNPLVRNQVIQDWCPLSLDMHLLPPFDHITFHGIHAFLTPSADQTTGCLDILLG